MKIRFTLFCVDVPEAAKDLTLFIFLSVWKKWWKLKKWLAERTQDTWSGPELLDRLVPRRNKLDHSTTADIERKKNWNEVENENEPPTFLSFWSIAELAAGALVIHHPFGVLRFRSFDEAIRSFSYTIFSTCHHATILDTAKSTKVGSFELSSFLKYNFWAPKNICLLILALAKIRSGNPSVLAIEWGHKIQFIISISGPKSQALSICIHSEIYTKKLFMRVDATSCEHQQPLRQKRWLRYKVELSLRRDRSLTKDPSPPHTLTFPDYGVRCFLKSVHSSLEWNPRCFSFSPFPPCSFFLSWFSVSYFSPPC